MRVSCREVDRFVHWVERLGLEDAFLKFKGVIPGVLPVIHQCIEGLYAMRPQGSSPVMVVLPDERTCSTTSLKISIPCMILSKKTTSRDSLPCFTTTPYASNAEGRGPTWCNSLFEDNAEFGLGFRVSIDKQKEFAGELLKKLAPQIGDDVVAAILHADQSDEVGIYEHLVGDCNDVACCPGFNRSKRGRNRL